MWVVGMQNKAVVRSNICYFEEAILHSNAKAQLKKRRTTLVQAALVEFPPSTMLFGALPTSKYSSWWSIPVLKECPRRNTALAHALPMSKHCLCPICAFPSAVHLSKYLLCSCSPHVHVVLLLEYYGFQSFAVVKALPLSKHRRCRRFPFTCTPVARSTLLFQQCQHCTYPSIVPVGVLPMPECRLCRSAALAQALPLSTCHLSRSTSLLRDYCHSDHCLSPPAPR